MLGLRPEATIHADEHLVHMLLRVQHPDLATLPVHAIEGGWDNWCFRLGDELAVRLPRRARAIPLMEHELRWLPVLAPRLPVPTSAPLRRGEPGSDFPHPWSVVPWIEGRTAAVAPLDCEAAAALAELWKALHVAAPPDAPNNPFRGVELLERDASVVATMAELERWGEDIEPARLAWQRGLDARPTRERTWLHGDPHPKNVLTQRGRLAGVIDWGDLCAGDRATDLASVWMLLPSHVHGEIWDALDVSDHDIARAGAWAAFYAVTLLKHGREADADFERVARQILARLRGADG